MQYWRIQKHLLSSPEIPSMKTTVHQASFPHLFSASQQTISSSINEDEQNIFPLLVQKRKKFPPQTTAHSHENIFLLNWSDKNYYFPCSDHMPRLINKELRDPNLLFDFFSFSISKTASEREQFLNRWSKVLNNNNWGWNDEPCVLLFILFLFYFFLLCFLAGK